MDETGRGGRTTDRAGKVLLALGFLLLIVSWAVTTPADSYPDEQDHYVRALAVAHGELKGAPDPNLTDEVEARALPKSCCDVGNPTSVAWVYRGARIVRIPNRLAPEHWRCSDVQARMYDVCTKRAGREGPTSGSGLHVTSMGTIEPLPYVLPGLAAHLTSDPNLALRLARLANGLLAASLLALAVWALWPRARSSGAAIIGLLVAVSPMVLFIAASPSPSSVEIAAAVAFMALLLRLVRPDRPQRSTWVAIGLAGLLLATSRSLGPVWIALDTAAAIAVAGWRTAWDRVREGGRWAAGAITVVALGALSTVAWEATAQPGVPFDSSFFRSQIGPAWGHLPVTLREVIGMFGWLDVHLSPGGYEAWAVAGGALALLALAAGRWRDRVLVVLLTGSVLGVAVLISSALLRQNGFNLQGRHVLGFAVSAPLVLGEVAARRSDRVPRWAGAATAMVVIVTTVAVQVNGILRSAEFYGLIRSQRPDLTWRPPGGIELWLVVAAAGATAIATGALLAQLRALSPILEPADPEEAPGG